MKICPHCQTTYTDDNLQFCLQDGNKLAAYSVPNSQIQTAEWNNEPQTVVRSGDQQQMRINLQEPPAAVPPTFSTAPQTQYDASPPRKSRWLLVVLGLLAVFVLLMGIGGIGAWFYLNSRGLAVVQNTNTSSNSNLSNANSEVNSNVNSANSNTTPVPTPTPKPILKPAELEAAKKEVESVIYGWKASAENHNLDTNLSNYADSVDYYKGGKISKGKLKSSKEPAYKKYDAISIDIGNMKVVPDPTGEKATATFDKTWDFAGTDKDGNEVFNSGSVQQQLILTKIEGKWKITSEKEIKVYYVDKGTGDEN